MVTHRGYSCSSITEDGSANTLPKQISSYRFRGEFIYDCGGRLPRCLKPGGQDVFLLATTPPNDNPGSLPRDYRAHVVSGGASAAGVRINAVQNSNSNFDYGTSQWDLIVITYEPFPVTDQMYVRQVRNALRAGGLLGVESFASDGDAKQRKPVDIDPAELLRTVLSSSLGVLRFEDVEGVSDWTLAKTRLARLIAQKM